jgi:PAS domain S-box-containing protein
MDRMDETADPPFHETAERMTLGMVFQVVVERDGSRRFTHVSPNCLDLNGVAAEAVLADARAFYDRFPPEHRRRLEAAEAQATPRLESYEVEVEFRRPDGTMGWSRITAAPRAGQADAVVWDGVQIDIGKRRRAEAEAEGQARRLELAVEATGLGFWEWDLRTGTLSWSDRMKAMYGLPPDARIDVYAHRALIHPDDRKLVSDRYFAVHNAQGGDFATEHRVVTPAGEVRWILSHGRVISDERGPRLAVGTTLDVTERRSAEERRALMMAEMAHRAKNGLSMLAGFVSQTARNSATVAEFEQTLLSRIGAMARSQDLITEAGGRPPRLQALMGVVLQPFDAGRFDLAGDLEAISLTSDQALGLALLFHELSTNALKYGALSNADGRILIEGRLENGQAKLIWRESGGPAVRAPTRSGFGSRLLKLALRQSGGRVDGRFEPDGFRAVVEFPSIAEPSPARA